MDAIKLVLYSPVQKDGRRHAIHWQTEGGQVKLPGLPDFDRLGLSEDDDVQSAIEKIADGIERSEGSIGIPIIGRALAHGEVAIPMDGWRAADGEYYVDIADEIITKDMIPYLVVLPECEATASNCGLKSKCRTFDGFLRIYAASPPIASIVVSLGLIGAKGGDTNGDMPIATRDRPGIVQIGDGLEVTDDGTLSVVTVNEDSAVQTISEILQD